MGIPELQHQISALERGIVSKRANVSQLDARIADLEAARPFAVAARDEAEGLARSLSYFALVKWAGAHADAFMREVGSGATQQESGALHQRCVELLEGIDRKLRSLRQERGSMQSSIAADERSISRARTDVRRLLKKK